MREILFRGKRLDNGEWVYGFYHNETSIESPSSERKITRHHIYTQDFDRFVIPETIGQYTGLKDKNGTKIFEGDIIKLPNGKNYFVFCGVTSFRYTRNKDYAKVLDPRDDYEVMGNIHDNPELLEEVRC